MAPHVDQEQDPIGNLSLPQLIHMLERNGHTHAADALRAGGSVAEATAYVAGGEPRYDDAEGRELQSYIDGLQRPRP
jgi:hypothetical protein